MMARLLRNGEVRADGRIDEIRAELGEVVLESVRTLSEKQAQQIINTPPTSIRETGVINDLELSEDDRVENAKRVLQKRLDYEEKNGHPEFKLNIAKYLSLDYGVSLSGAIGAVFSKDFQALIYRDMVWSQHMGTIFWANEIYEAEFSGGDSDE